MLIKEYRIPLPLTLEEYSIAQLYMIQVCYIYNADIPHCIRGMNIVLTGGREANIFCSIE
jgi:hypothetical protein